MITARAGTGCGVVGGRLVVVGGEGAATATGVFSEVEAYDPASDSWESLTPMPTPRHGMAAAVWDGALHVPGGARSAGFGAVATHEVLTP
jgi:N-acetylneuraminic acid mutarotase